MTNTKLSNLESFLLDHPHIPYATPSSPNYPTLREIFSKDRPDNPLVIVRPQSATDVALLVDYAKSHDLKFTVRGGGHGLSGHSMVEGALTIDMRDIAFVSIASDSQSATIGGGILSGALAEELWKEGLATPTGSIPSVGYVGWATYGGYGPFSAHWGLGADQIIGAKIVNASGDIVQADEGGLLKGIRGAGGILGVIVELTIKVYSLKSILAGSIIYDSRDISATFQNVNSGYQKLATEGLPPELTVQQMVVHPPPGKMMGIAFMWSSEDTQKGREWLEKFQGLGSVIMNTVQVTTIPNWYAANAALVPSTVYGTGRTHSVRTMSSKATALIGRNLEKMPSNPGVMFSVHELRGPSAMRVEGSVFGSREPHFMLEILGMATVEDVREQSTQWACNLWNELLDEAGENILPGAYISLDYRGQDFPISKYFGAHSEEVLALKKRFDSENIFGEAVPSLKVQ